MAAAHVVFGAGRLVRRVSPSRLQRPAEKAHVAIRIGDFESAQTVVGVVEDAMECDLTVNEISSQSIGILDEDEHVPPGPRVPNRVGRRQDAVDRFQHELCGAASDDGKKGIVIGCPVADIETERTVIMSERCRHVADDEEGRTRADLGYGGTDGRHGSAGVRLRFGAAQRC